MDYEKKYKEALEVAQKLYQDCPNGKNDRLYHTTDLEKMFPELRESEDERIRKELIEHVKDQQSSFISAPDCRDKYEEEENNKYNSWLDWLEKQGNQKSKKVSIWNHWKDGICGNGDGKLIYLIKDGDDYSLSSSLAYECDYIVLSDLDKLMVQEKQGEPADKVEPKFKKAGYQWDSEKKEWEKIEQKQEPIIQINPSEYINDMGGNGCYLKNATQVSAWTEDDKKHMANILTTLLMESKNAKTEQYRSIVESDIDWIYSLKNKDRVQPKQWWGEEDEHRINLLEALCEDKLFESVPNSTMYGEMRTTIDWLKSLRNRITWKPTEEQLKSLQEVIDVGHFTSYPNVLETLYEHLKKL